MTTLIVQIPCYNEAQTLAETITDLPRSLPGIDRVQVLVVDDGSSDDSAHVALKSGADFVVRHRRNRGLARAFMTGLNAALALGADIIVNTDADHQYPGCFVPALVSPILSGAADMTIGDRQPAQNLHFSPLKRSLETLGSWFIRMVSGTDAQDAVSGFRAYSRYAALGLHVYNTYSYTLETLIQAGKEGMKIAHVPIETNPTSRPSRLHRGMLSFIWRQSGTIIRSYVLYQPLKSFVFLGIPFLSAGAFLIARFLFFYVTGDSGIGRHVQSVSIGGTLSVLGLFLIILGLLGDAVRANRKVMEEILVRLRAQSAGSSQPLSEINGSTLIRADKDRHDL